MDRTKPIFNASLIYAIQRFVDRRRSSSSDLVPCYCVNEKCYSTASGLRAIQLNDGTYKICNIHSCKH